MKAVAVMLSETVAAETWLATDYLAPSGLSCADCGLTPANVNNARRPNPSTALLEPVGVNHDDPLLRSVYRCRNRAACNARRRLTPA